MSVRNQQTGKEPATVIELNFQIGAGPESSYERKRRVGRPGGAPYPPGTTNSLRMVGKA